MRRRRVCTRRRLNALALRSLPLLGSALITLEGGPPTVQLACWRTRGVGGAHPNWRTFTRATLRNWRRGVRATNRRGPDRIRARHRAHSAGVPRARAHLVLPVKVPPPTRMFLRWRTACSRARPCCAPDSLEPRGRPGAICSPRRREHAEYGWSRRLLLRWLGPMPLNGRGVRIASGRGDAAELATYVAAPAPGVTRFANGAGMVVTGDDRADASHAEVPALGRRHVARERVAWPDRAREAAARRAGDAEAALVFGDGRGGHGRGRVGASACPSCPR